MRAWTVRMPAASASAVEASHAWQTSARKPVPGASASVMGVAPRSP